MFHFEIDTFAVKEIEDVFKTDNLVFNLRIIQWLFAKFK